MLRQVIVLCTILYAIATCAQQTTASTQSMGNTEVAQLLTVIRNQELQENDPEKVVQAMERLGNIRAVESIDDLIGLLSFRRTFSWEKPNSGIIVHMVTTADRYPAVSALFEIGKPAVPSLIGVIAKANSPKLACQNATYALMAIYRDDPATGIRLLSESAKKSRTPSEAERLREAGKNALQWCLQSERAQCEAVLNESSQSKK